MNRSNSLNCTGKIFIILYLPNELKNLNQLILLVIFGGGGGSRTYGGPYSHKGLQRFTECLPNIR
jgi:hypothetical protein